MERAEWLKRMRGISEALYDRFSSQYGVDIGSYENETQLAFIQKFLALLPPGGAVLSAACGAGRYDGILLDAGHPVTGTDQSAGMLERARQRFPQARYQKSGLQEMDFDAAFDGAICMDAMEHICPEDWPVIVRNFAKALKPGGLLYLNVDARDKEELEQAYERGKALGLPLVFGEVADGVEPAYHELMAIEGPLPLEKITDSTVYHFVPSPEQARAWFAQAGFSIVEEGDGSGYHHILARKA